MLNLDHIKVQEDNSDQFTFYIHTPEQLLHFCVFRRAYQDLLNTEKPFWQRDAFDWFFSDRFIDCASMFSPCHMDLVSRIRKSIEDDKIERIGYYTNS